ncbi:MAG: DinB family protein [Cryomorphaceae bacterium]
MEIYKRFTPEQNEYGAFYANYLKNVEGMTISEALKADIDMFENLANLKGLDIHTAYEPGKWTIAELLLHCIDTERVFAGRITRLLRKDKTPLPGFDQDDFVMNSHAKNHTVKDLVRQWDTGRDFTLSLFLNAEDSAMEFIGSASGYPISARALALIIPGHNLHHYRILRERYGLDI